MRYFSVIVLIILIITFTVATFTVAFIPSILSLGLYYSAYRRGATVSKACCLGGIFSLLLGFWFMYFYYVKDPGGIIVYILFAFLIGAVGSLYGLLLGFAMGKTPTARITSERNGG